MVSLYVASRMRQCEPELSFSMHPPLYAKTLTLNTFFSLPLVRGCALLRLVHSLKVESFATVVCRKVYLEVVMILKASFNF
jgi:hypothetical protein